MTNHENNLSLFHIELPCLLTSFLEAVVFSPKAAKLQSRDFSRSEVNNHVHLKNGFVLCGDSDEDGG